MIATRSAPTRRSARLLRLAGDVTILFGVVTAISYLARARGTDALEAAPVAALTRLDDSLGFLLLGSAIFALSYCRARWAIVFAGGLLVLSTVTGLQGIFADANPPIHDVALVRFFLSSPNDPARMGPNVALLFSLSAGGLLLLGIPPKVTWRLPVAGICGCIVAGLASLAIAGHAISLESAYRWGSSRPMTLAVAAPFLLVGTALFFFAATRGRSRHGTLAGWVPLSIACGGLAAAVMLWHALTVDRIGFVNWIRSVIFQKKGFAELYLAELALATGVAITLLLAIAVHSARKASLRAGERRKALRALQTAQAVLERRVEERTSEIASVNEELQREIRSREELEVVLRQRAELLGDADRRKDEFLAMLGHELRNPLAALSHALDTLGIERPGSASFADTLDVMRNRLTHILRLVDDLLDVSRVTRGKIRLRKRRLDIGEVVTGVLDGMRPLAEQHGHSISVSLPRGPLRVEADDVRLEQIVSNLLSNAIKYTPRSGRIEVELERRDETALLRVRDSGVGISSEFLPRIFDSFEQENPSLDRTGGGLGVGLTLARRLAVLHGGTIEAHSEGVGRGSEFVLRLPLATGAGAREVEGPRAVEALPASASRRVLIVEDREDLRRMFELLLTRWGHEVFVARDGQRALEVCSAAAPEAALIDIGLPGMNGYDLAVRLREELSDGILLIALTGYAQPRHRRRAREAGFDHHLVKPVDIDELERLLGKASSREPVS